MSKSEQVRQEPIPQGQEPVYLMETRDGFLVRVPESRLEAWQEAQRTRKEEPLNRQEQQLADRLLQRLLKE